MILDLKKLLASYFPYQDMHFIELVRGSGVAFAAKLLGAVSAFGLNVVIARQYGVSGSGLFFLAYSVILISSVIARVGLENALVLHIATDATTSSPSRAKATFLTAIGIAVSLSLLVMFALRLGADRLSISVFNNPDLSIPLQIMSLAIPAITLYTLIAYALQGLKRVAEYIFVLSIMMPLTASVLCLIAGSGQNIELAIIVLVAASYITLALGFLLWSWRSEQLGAYEDFLPLRKLMSTSIPMYGVVLLNVVITWSPTLILGAWASSEAVGLYSAASRSALLISFVLVAANSIVAPKFAALFHQTDISVMERLSRKSAKLMTLASAPIVLFFLLFPDAVLGMFGGDFVNEEGRLVLRILAIGQLCNVMCGSVGQILLMTGNARAHRSNLIMSFSWGILTCLLLIPAHGAVGAAFAAATTLTLSNALAVYKVRKILNIDPFPFSLIFLGSKA